MMTLLGLALGLIALVLLLVVTDRLERYIGGRK